MTRIEQGPQVGRQYPAEKTASTDDETGATVHRLTDSRAHDHHLYFTNPGWYGDGDRLLFASDRTGVPNLFSIELEGGEITQLTDLPALEDDREVRGHYDFPFLPTSVNPDRPEAYFWRDDALVALDLEDRSLRVLWERPDGFDATITNVTADGEYLCTSIAEEVGTGMTAIYEAFPESRVLEVPVDGGDVRVLHEEAHWVGHVNTSPTRPEFLTFCHEGPWSRVDNRIWGLNRETGEVWRIRPRREEGERVGHEFWLADGETIGYHGATADGEPFFGVTRHDNTGGMETAIDPDSVHFHANDRDLVVGDGTRDDPYVTLYDFGEDEDGDYEARRLAHHRGTWHVQGVHVHARFSPDGSQVLYTTDHLGYGNVYLADVPASLGDLPRV